MFEIHSGFIFKNICFMYVSACSNQKVFPSSIILKTICFFDLREMGRAPTAFRWSFCAACCIFCLSFVVCLYSGRMYGFSFYPLLSETFMLLFVFHQASPQKTVIHTSTSTIRKINLHPQI